MEIFTQTQVRWNPASLHLAFRGNEELAFTLNITNVNTHIKKKIIGFSSASSSLYSSSPLSKLCCCHSVAQLCLTFCDPVDWSTPGDDRGWDGWMASQTQWTWVWVGSRSWWWTGRPSVLQSMGSQRVGHDWVTELNWCCRFSHVWLFATPQTVAHQVSQSMEFSRQEYWSGLPFPPPKDLPNPGIELATTALQEDSLPLSHQGSPKLLYIPATYLLPPARGSTASQLSV